MKLTNICIVIKWPMLFKCSWFALVFLLPKQKERDLELAARIGQNLLDKNKDLEEKNEQLEEQLTQATDSVSRSNIYKSM